MEYSERIVEYWILKGLGHNEVMAATLVISVASMGLFFCMKCNLTLLIMECSVQTWQLGTTHQAYDQQACKLATGCLSSCPGQRGRRQIPRGVSDDYDESTQG